MMEPSKRTVQTCIYKSIATSLSETQVLDKNYTNATPSKT